MADADWLSSGNKSSCSQERTHIRGIVLVIGPESMASFRAGVTREY